MFFLFGEGSTLKSSNQKEDALVFVPMATGFHLVKNMFFPLLVLKGTYHYFVFCCRGLNQMEAGHVSYSFAPGRGRGAHPVHLQGQRPTLPARVLGVLSERPVTVRFVLGPKMGWLWVKTNGIPFWGR